MSLPSGYRKLEYIQSSGTQYIDTGFKPNQDTRVVTKISFNVLTSGTSSYAFGAANSGSSGMFEISTGNNLIRLGYGGTAVTQTFPSTKPFTIDFNKNVVTINGTAYTLTAATFTGTYSMYICDTNRGKAYRAIPAVTVYSFQIYDNGTLVRDFIPCKNASGVVGMWDDVNDTFYSNAGSGTFTAGPEVKGTNKTLIDGTAYGVETGKCLISGTAYALKKGRTLIGGTGYDVKLTKNSYLITFIYEKDVAADARSTATLYYGTQEIQSGQTFEIQKGETLIFQNSSPYAWTYVYLYVDGEYQGSFEASNSYTPAKYEFTPTADCEIKAVLGRNESDAKWYVTTS